MTAGAHEAARVALGLISVVRQRPGLPLAERAQSAERAKRLGVLMSTREGDPAAVTRVAKFRDGLAQLGWHDGTEPADRVALGRRRHRADPPLCG